MYIIVLTLQKQRIMITLGVQVLGIIWLIWCGGCYRQEWIFGDYNSIKYTFTFIKCIAAYDFKLYMRLLILHNTCESQWNPCLYRDDSVAWLIYSLHFIESTLPRLHDFPQLDCHFGDFHAMQYACRLFYHIINYLQFFWSWAKSALM